MTQRSLKLISIVAGLYVAAQIFADIASLRVVQFAGLSIAGGALVYPLTFTLRDMLHKASSAGVARAVIFTAAALNLVMALLMWLISSLPSAAPGEVDSFTVALSPTWRLIFASIIAELSSELLDTRVYEWWQQRHGDARQWGRVLASNAVSVPFDCALFVILAFAGDLPTEVVLTIFASNLVVKLALAILSVPGIYLVKSPQEYLRWKNEDSS